MVNLAFYIKIHLLVSLGLIKGAYFVVAGFPRKRVYQFFFQEIEEKQGIYNSASPIYLNF